VVDATGRFHERASGFDLGLDTVGVATFDATLRSLRLGGRAVVVGNIQNEKARVNLGFLITRGLTVIGGSGATRREMAELLGMHAAQPFDAAIARIFPLSRADEAQRALRAGGVDGRFVLVPEASS
jgi:acryloyl-coenzyme A reductase